MSLKLSYFSYSFILFFVMYSFNISINKKSRFNKLKKKKQDLEIDIQDVIFIPETLDSEVLSLNL